MRFSPAALPLLALCLTARPAAADTSVTADAFVTVTAPALAQARSLADWYRQTVPLPFQTDSPLTVQVLTPDAMRRYLQGAGADDADAPQQTMSPNDDADDVDGAFDTDPDTITLRQNADGLPDLWTFAHELGHEVWTRKLTAKDRAAYSSVYAQQKKAGHLVTRYAAQSTEEGFAEAFSFYVCAPPMLYARDPLSFAFLRQWERARR